MHKFWLIWVVYFTCLFLAATVAYKNPYYNWDMLPYMALVLKKEHKDISVVHKLTYEIAKKHMRQKEFANLVDSPIHRLRRSQDAIVFNEVLPFYMVKPLYIEIVYLFYKAGFNLPISTMLPSIISYLLIGLLVFEWLAKHLKLMFAFCVGLLVMFLPFIVNVARLSSPDGVSALFLVTSFYFIVEKPSLILMFIFLLLSVLCRLDNIVIATLIIVLLFFISNGGRKLSFFQFVTTLCILSGTYLAITINTDGHNWNFLYYPTFIKYYDVSHQYNSEFSLSKYFSVVLSKISSTLFYSHITLFFLLVLIQVQRFHNKLKELPFDLLLACLLAFTIIIRFFLFPDFEDRFYVSYYLFILITFICRNATLRIAINSPEER